MNKLNQIFLLVMLVLSLHTFSLAKVSNANVVPSRLPNGVSGSIQGFYKSVRRDWGMGEPRYVNCDVLVVTEGADYIINPLVDMVRNGNNVNQLDDQGRLLLNLNLNGVPQALKRRVIASTLQNTVKLTVQARELEGRGASDCESFVSLVAIDDVALSGAPQAKSIIGAQGNSSINANSPQTSEDAATWFFKPHPLVGKLEAVRKIDVVMQTFQRGMMLYLGDVNQTFILFKDGAWANVGGKLDDVAAQYVSQLGRALTSKHSFQSCGGHSVVGDQVIAYLTVGLSRKSGHNNKIQVSNGTEDIHQRV